MHANIFTWLICKKCCWKKRQTLILESLLSSQSLFSIKNRLLYHLVCPGSSSRDGFDKVNYTVAWEIEFVFPSWMPCAHFGVCTIGYCPWEGRAAPGSLPLSMCDCLVDLNHPIICAPFVDYVTRGPWNVIHGRVSLSQGNSVPNGDPVHFWSCRCYWQNLRQQTLMAEAFRFQKQLYFLYL